MNKSSKKIQIIYFLLLQLIIFYWVFIYESDLYLLLYFCYHAPLLIVITHWFNLEKKLIPSIIMIGLFAQLLYVFDFVIAMIIQDSYLNYFEFHLNTPIWSKILVLMAHLSTTVLLLTNYTIKPTISHLKYSFSYFIVLYFPILLYVPQYYNVNAIVKTYTILDNLPLYQELYLLYTLIFVLIPTYYLLKLIEKISVKK